MLWKYFWNINVQNVPLMELYTLYLLASQMRVTISSSDLHCCVCNDVFRAQINWHCLLIFVIWMNTIIVTQLPVPQHQVLQLMFSLCVHSMFALVSCHVSLAVLPVHDSMSWLFLILSSRTASSMRGMKMGCSLVAVEWTEPMSLWKHICDDYNLTTPHLFSLFMQPLAPDTFNAQYRWSPPPPPPSFQNWFHHLSILLPLSYQLSSGISSAGDFSQHYFKWCH